MRASQLLVRVLVRLVVQIAQRKNEDEVVYFGRVLYQITVKLRLVRHIHRVAAAHLLAQSPRKIPGLDSLLADVVGQRSVVAIRQCQLQAYHAHAIRAQQRVFHQPFL